MAGPAILLESITYIFQCTPPTFECDEPLISNNIPARKSYFDSNIIYKQKCKDMATFFLKIILKRTSTESHDYMRRHQGAKVEHFDVSNVIYQKFSHGAVSYTVNGESVNVMLELPNHNMGYFL